MEPSNMTLHLLIEAYETSPTAKNVLALKDFLGKCELSGSAKLIDSVKEVLLLLEKWEELDNDSHATAISLLGN